MAARGGRTRALIGAAGLTYLAAAVVIWGQAWFHGASTHTLCGCGDPALFLWFFQWPATAVAHGHNPFFSTALFHPGGINLLAQTSVMGLSIPLAPVTWIWGPVATLNVASTLAPALSAFFCFLVLRRWVPWMPAAFLGGLLYGFSPFVLSNLATAHLMTAALMLLPVILAVLDEILIRQTRSPRLTGLWLGLLVFAQFFFSTELLAVMAIIVVPSLFVLVAYASVFHRDRLRALAPHAAGALLVGGVVGAVLLAWPVWFALDGPGHLSGLIWPNIGSVGGYGASSFVTADVLHGSSVYTALGGYEGKVLPSSAYLGWGLLGTLAGGLLIWFRDRRLWFFGFLLALCVICSLGERPGEWEPARVFAHIPVIENVIEQRFMAVGFLAAAVMLAIILDHVRREVPARLELTGVGAAAAGVSAALAATGVALVPIATTFAPSLPYTMKAVTLPRWYATVAPHLPPNRVLLSYPVPFSGIQVAMAWQAVNGMNYSQVGGGGPQGVSARAGAARGGFNVLSPLAFGVFVPQPTGTPAEFAATRHALDVWRVTTVVIATNPTVPVLQRGHDPTYAAAFMTAALGRLPVIEAGAWVWNNVSVSHGSALIIPPGSLKTCVSLVERGRRGLPAIATLKVADCVGLEALSVAR